MPLKSSGLVTGFLYQPSGCVGIGPYGKETTLAPIDVVDLVEQFLAAAVLVPGEDHVGVHAISGTRPPERERVLLTVVIREDPMTAVEGTLRHGIEQAEGGDYGARRQHLDFQVAARHLVDLLGIVEGELVKDVLLRPGALPAHRGNPLRLDDCRESRELPRPRQQPLLLVRCGVTFFEYSVPRFSFHQSWFASFLPTDIRNRDIAYITVNGFRSNLI